MLAGYTITDPKPDVQERESERWRNRYLFRMRIGAFQVRCTMCGWRAVIEPSEELLTPHCAVFRSREEAEAAEAADTDLEWRRLFAYLGPIRV